MGDARGTLAGETRLQSGWSWRSGPHGIEMYSLASQERVRLGGGVSADGLQRLLSSLDTWTPVSELVDRCGPHMSAAEVESVLAALTSRAVVIIRTGGGAPRPAEERDEYFDRQERFLHFFETDEASAHDFQARLRHARVLLVGAGGWGTWTALLLSRVGIGELVVLDDDRVELSNLNRQVLYSPADIGRPKVEVLAEQITRETGGRTRVVAVDTPVRSADDLARHVRAADDLVMNSFGYGTEFFRQVARMALELGLTCLNYGANWVGPMTVPGQTPCLGCLSADEAVDGAATRWVADWLLPARSEGGVMAPRAALNCSVAVWEAAQHLGGFRRPQSRGGVIMLDSFDYDRTRLHPLERAAGCAWCEGSAEDD